MKKLTLALAFLILALIAPGARAFTITIGTGDYYTPVGDYDYLPYAFGTPGFAQPRISFDAMMSDYGTWVSVSPFGRAWQPYAAQGWRPYMYGNWQYTQYGPTWQGYEPWAWAGYHYGNWIFSQQYGWVWIPGNEWHPGRVSWSHGYDSIGWMPLPPNGFDYSRGYLSQVGPYNQFGYNDDDWGISIGLGEFSYGGPYYDPRYQNSYYNPSYLNLVPMLWTFIQAAAFNNDNYADYYLGPDYSRYLFDRRIVRITSRPVERTVLERIVRQPIRTVAVKESQLQTDKGTLRVVTPDAPDAVEKVRRHSTEVVREVIAPAFAEKQKPLKGDKAKNKQSVDKVFRQENVQPKVETVDSSQLVERGRAAKQRREQKRAALQQEAKGKIVQIEKEGKIKEAKKGKGQQQNKPDKERQPGSTGAQLQQEQKEQKERDAKRAQIRQQQEEEEKLQRNAPSDRSRTERDRDEQVTTPQPFDRPEERQDAKDRNEKEKERGVRPEPEPQKAQQETEETADVKSSDKEAAEKAEAEKQADAKKKAKAKKSKDKDKDKEDPPSQE